MKNANYIRRLLYSLLGIKKPIANTPMCGLTATDGDFRPLRSTVRPLFRKSLIFVSSLIKHLRTEIETITTIHMPEVVSDLSDDFKEMF
jgi:hypothetical protein